MFTMETLKKQRASSKRKISRAQKFFEESTEQTTLEEFTVRLEALEDAWKEFNHIHTELIAMTKSKDTEELEGEFELMESAFLKLKSQFLLNIKLRQAKPNANPVQPTPIQVPTQGSSSPDIRLPRLDLPRFSGNHLEWCAFKDIFVSLIHSNNNLTSAQKMHYLKSALSGEAASLLHSLEVSDTNYSQAWDLLHDRYHNTRLLVNAHIRALVGQSTLTGESASGIRKLIDNTAKHMRALKMLNVRTEYWHEILVFLLVEKLDVETRRDWELANSTKTCPSFTDLKTYLEKRCYALEAAPSRQKKQVISNSSSAMGGKSSFKALTSSVTGATNSTCCCVCKQDHALYRCSEFIGMSVKQRANIVKDQQLCFNCLRANHNARQCSSETGCHKCGKHHHTLLHSENPFTGTTTDKAKQTQHENSALSSYLGDSNEHNTLLSTALVKLLDVGGQPQLCRVLLDSGSQASLITDDCVQRLGISRSKSKVSISGVGQLSNIMAKGSVNITVCSHTSDFSIPVNALVLNKITNYGHPVKLQNIKRKAEGLNIALADDFDFPGKVDLLLGADVFAELFIDGNIKAKDLGCTALNTRLGWVLSGRVEDDSSPQKQVTISVSHAMVDLQRQLKSFWEIEELPTVKQLTKEELQCEELFQKTHYRDPLGRYHVKLLMRHDPPQLGESHELARRRLLHMERRLAQSPEVKSEYTSFLSEYLSSDHMELVPLKERRQSPPSINYLPHHYVTKPDSSTTRLRIVFDGSAKTSSGTSLNDEMMIGPKLQQDIWEILLRFRTHKIGFMADIAKMYRQIRVDSQSANLQRILWRPEPDAEIQEFRLKTVTYGTACAPYLAIRVLHQLACDERTNFPLTSEIITRDFYVDDLISGAQTLTEAQNIQKELIALLANGGFQLRKWSSNEPAMLDHLPDEYRARDSSLQMGEMFSCKALGIHWNITDDNFFFTVKFESPIAATTKRMVLSQISRLYDPLGWISPIVICAKIFIQHLWIAGISWDEDLPVNLQSEWNNFFKSLPYVETIRVPRFIRSNANGLLQLHGFADASERAYGAAIYLRVACSDESATVNLVCSKTRVAPVKQISVPRLELCAAALLAHLLQRVKSALQVQVESVHAWTDSTVCLSWIRGMPRQWKTFVANRVAEIQGLLPPDNWRHVSSEDNPADMASRGMAANELAHSKLWWFGPSWLAEREELWPRRSACSRNDSEVQLERKTSRYNAISPTAVQLLSTSAVDTSTHSLQRSESGKFQWPLIEKYSSFVQLSRVTAWCLRFVHNARVSRDQRRIGVLSTHELQQAIMVCVRSVQQEVFHDSFSNMSRATTISSLSPFRDAENVIRVGGRLSNSKIGFERKFPILLPKNHNFTDMIIRHHHIQQLHGGPQATLAAIRRQFWIIHGRNTVRRVLHKCITCVRDKGRVVQQSVGDLPVYRTELVRPFLRTGVDFAGPFHIKVHQLRNARIVKCYFALFVCFGTKAVHLEAVSDLSTSAFLAAFKRFTSRRGMCSDIWSDHGTNFGGANAELKRLWKVFQSTDFNNAVAADLAIQNVNWHFIPPRAPHFGGLWEAGVKSAKTLLRRIVGETRLTYEEFATMLTAIEACLNSRPLCPLSNDPDDLEVLTPGHFLVGHALTALPEQNWMETPVSRLQRWHLTQRLTQLFWKRWQQEYLTQVHQHKKNPSQTRELQVGDLVLIGDKGSPPLTWPRGRVSAVHPGPDGKVRVVTIKTRSAEYTRPVVKLCYLPTD